LKFQIASMYILRVILYYSNHNYHSPATRYTVYLETLGEVGYVEFVDKTCVRYWFVCFWLV